MTWPSTKAALSSTTSTRSTPASWARSSAGVERPQQAEPDEAQAEGVPVGRAETEVPQRADDGLVGEARGDDGEAGAAGLERHPVETGPAGVVEDAGEPDVEQVLLGQRGGGAEQQRPLHWPVEVRCGDPAGRVVEVDRRHAVGDVGDDLEGGPDAGVTGEGDRVQAEGADVGHRAGGEQRDGQAAGHPLRRARQRRRLAERVVADHRDRAAERRRAGEVAVPDGVGRPVEAGVLAEPEAGDAVVAPAVELAEQLGAGHRGGGQLLVDAGREDDAGVVEEGRRPVQLEVEAAERRPLVAADEDAGVEAAGPVEAALVDRQADERLDPGQQDAAGRGRVLVVEADGGAGGGGVRVSGRSAGWAPHAPQAGRPTDRPSRADARSSATSIGSFPDDRASARTSWTRPPIFRTASSSRSSPQSDRTAWMCATRPALRGNRDVRDAVPGQDGCARRPSGPASARRAPENGAVQPVGHVAIQPGSTIRQDRILSFDR